jgi:hypothetical protein
MQLHVVIGRGDIIAITIDYVIQKGIVQVVESLTTIPTKRNWLIIQLQQDLKIE